MECSKSRVWEEVILPQAKENLLVCNTESNSKKYLIRCLSNVYIDLETVLLDFNSKRWRGRMFSIKKTQAGCFIFLSDTEVEEGDITINNNSYTVINKNNKKSKKPPVVKASIFNLPPDNKVCIDILNNIGTLTEECSFPDTSRTYIPRAEVTFSAIFFPHLLLNDTIEIKFHDKFRPLIIRWYKFVRDNKTDFINYFDTNEQINQIAERSFERAIAKSKSKPKSNELKTAEHNAAVMIHWINFFQFYPK